MNLTRVTDASTEPISIGEAKLHLRETLVSTENDAYIMSLVTACRHAAELDLHRCLIEATWRLAMPGFCFLRSMALPMPYLRSVEHVKYYDADGALQTLSSADYLVVTDGEPGAVVLKDGSSWPATYSRPDAVVVTYKAGYGTTAASVPMPVRHWMKTALTDLYNVRALSADKLDLPRKFTDSLLGGHRFYGTTAMTGR